MIHFLISVLSHTPVWVWGLLAALIALGLHQAREHVVSGVRVLIQPLAMGTLALVSASTTFGWHATVQPLWAAGFAIGFALNRWLMLPRSVRPLPDGRYAIGGSWSPLVLLMAIFLLRYAVAASLAIVPGLSHELLFAALASALYGLPSGLLAARASHVLGSHRAAGSLQPA